MSNDFMACMSCRPIWQSFRRAVDEIELAPDRRRAAISDYMQRVHASGHDEAKVRADLQAEHEIQQAARAEMRHAVALWALEGLVAALAAERTRADRAETRIAEARDWPPSSLVRGSVGGVEGGQS